MKKSISKILRQIANEFPDLDIEEKTPVHYSGQELLLTGKGKDKNGMAINPNESYTLNVQTFRRVDHYNKLKDIYKNQISKGMPHVMEAILQYKKEVQNQPSAK